ncbi:TetR/AcrR family transcriptional regulator [Catenulispora sp. NF23]|uniref:TetR/AcrR family transcriptional regulator n=1 Tax=Catenulispora pinistramenti TaxID=2705254 RepID=A0ABS5KTX8_9ACTN|nr:TetR/AcrR family transcriptional regulator [Catenulispora pinistramenti]MBS2536836.1 TetR/AcrR family transcriptional regulator [Catenulispora pinistramenti]MBS2549489.1 TetR/AcrR family transcriptional regulator [Catenulispora pinistramenti]
MPKGMTKRRPQTLAKLLDAALEAFAENGFGGTRIEDVCERAGYTRGAFYSNFASKEELFFALFDRHAERVLERFERQAAALGTGPLTVQDIAAGLADFDQDERTWYLVTTEFTLSAIRDPGAAQRLAEHDARLRVEAVRLLGELLTRAGMRTRDGVELESLVRMLIAVREGALAQSYVEPGVLPPGSLERLFLPALLGAVTEAV